MPAPSELAIATKAVERLTKEERYYQSELVRQQERVQKLEEEIKKGGADLDPNAEFILRQEVSCVDTHHSALQIAPEEGGQGI